jgi:orotate phosphoribosyltransferase
MSRRDAQGSVECEVGSAKFKNDFQNAGLNYFFQNSTLHTPYSTLFLHSSFVSLLAFPARILQRPGMDSTANEVLDIFKRTGALLEGHFVLRSGLHSTHFFQCAQVCQNMEAVTRLCQLLLAKLGRNDFATVLAPAMGGLVLGQEVARQTGKRFIFAEKVNDKLALRRNFKFAPGERVLVVEDVITRGGRVQECLDLISTAGAVTAGVLVLVDRSEGKTHFKLPHVALLEMSFPTYEADKLPPALAALPATKPGS